MNNAIVALVIIGAWAFAATIVTAVALTSLSRIKKTLTGVRKDRDNALDIANGFKREVERLQRLAFPARDGSDGISVGRALRKITGPVKPTSARTPSTSRTSDSTDSFAAGVLASTLWSGNYGSPDSGSSSSCDTSSSSSSYSDSGSSSSSDGGSCGGGE
jgi:hypothetical protein